VITDNDKRPHKLPRIALSSDLYAENGRRIPEAKEFAVQLAPSNRSGAADSTGIEQRVDSRNTLPALYNKVQETNGKVDSRLPLVSMRPSISSHAEAGGPLRGKIDNDLQDLRYTLSFPVKEAWSDFDDQGWLFDSNHLQSKPKAVMEVDKGIPQVWSEALHLESVDIHALPFVIPY
jgi:hypothetical protein